jgi:protein ImuA
MSRVADFMAVRAKVAALEAGSGPARGVAPFGDARIDAGFPGGGLPLGCWHELAGEGLEVETGAAAGAFAAVLAGMLARRRSGVLVWVMRREDLYAPGLEALGLPAGRLIQVAARDEIQVLAALEDALGSAGVVAAVGEAGEVDLTAGRRMQLACEKHGATGLVIRRRPFGGRVQQAGGEAEPGSAAASRWSVSAAPSVPPSGVPGLGAARWRVELRRRRGGRPGGWIMEQSDGACPLRVVAELGDRQLAPAQPWRRAG